MKLSNWGALAAALALAGVSAPPAVHAQSPQSLVRALDIGRGAYIGVTVHDADGTDAKEPKGVVIEVVAPDSPADKAGIKAGDAITEFDGERVRSTLQFSRLVRETPGGRSVPVALTRAGQRVTVTVTPDRSAFGDEFSMRLLDAPRARLAIPPTPPAPPTAPRAPRPPAFASPDFPFEPFELFGRTRNTGRLGITLEDLDTQLAEYFGVKEGALVKSVAADSAGSKAGLKAGDVITAINGRHVYDSSDVTRALDRVESNGEFTLDVTRDRKTQTLKGKLEPREARARTRVRTTV
jgi:serine protease Do